ncbi:FkbM family methyltransferase [Flexithrix dorotheae]|uniref:FkbM family methyltransferase n=1 Tax=Flexithrix dorotheae TaxID=70993 RepID=UPI00036F2FB0|nr:FkbM family methyltransferase [Flexithrix dorotheae]
MKKFLKNTIKSYLRKKGKIIKPYNETEEKVQLVQYNWLKNLNIKTIIDVGASNGGFAIKARGWFRDASIYSFEPIPNSYQKLLQNFDGDKKFNAFNYGLSNLEGESSFFICDNNTGSSSLLEMDNLHKKAYPHTSENTKITIKTSTLDKWSTTQEYLENDILLKMDVQGAELFVLQGAHEFLSKVKILITEVSFNSLYKNSVSFESLYDFLKKYGFLLRGLENISQSTIDGTFLQADAFFIKELDE